MFLKKRSSSFTEKSVPEILSPILMIRSSLNSTRLGDKISCHTNLPLNNSIFSVIIYARCVDKKCKKWNIREAKRQCTTQDASLWWPRLAWRSDAYDILESGQIFVTVVEHLRCWRLGDARHVGIPLLMFSHVLHRCQNVLWSNIHGGSNLSVRILISF